MVGIATAISFVGRLLLARQVVSPFMFQDEGGYVGTLLGGGLALAIGSTGVAIAGILTLLAGALLVTGASAGAMLRSSGRAVHRAARKSIPPRRPAADCPRSAGASAADWVMGSFPDQHGSAPVVRARR